MTDETINKIFSDPDEFILHLSPRST